MAKYGDEMKNVLDPLDHAMYEFGRATGVDVLIQCVWVYESGIDLDGVRRFHELLQQGRLSRRIERSPLPFGRHRWVSPSSAPEMEVATALPRGQFDSWLNEKANTTRLDPERGPGWHLAVLPFTDGGAGVSLLAPHCLTDGVGFTEAVADAVGGRRDPVSWPATGSRSRWRAVREDGLQTARDIPALARAVGAALRSVRRASTDAASPPTTQSSSPAGDGRPIRVSTATMLVDAEEWDTRAQALGGTSNSLLVGITARLADLRGRVAPDGWVAVRIPLNERTPSDTRGNAARPVDIRIDPAIANTDLREIRGAIKEALMRHRGLPDDEGALLSLVPLLPKRLLKKIAGNGTGVVSTHLGALNPATTRVDGTDADSFAMKMHYAGATERIMHQFGGVQIVASGRANGQVFVMVHAYQPDRPNSDEALQHDLCSVLKEFSLTGTHL